MTAIADTILDRVESIDWVAVEASLDRQGFASLPVLLDPVECEALARMYVDEDRFRSRIDMSRFRFGVGEYKYFAAPLPALVQLIREALYARLAPVANRWRGRLRGRRSEVRSQKYEYPPTLNENLARCHKAGQTRPTPLLLSYDVGGYNCLHQDIYGDLAFPLQAVFALSRSDVDYSGGELVFVEQRPRAQSRAHAARLEQGSGIVFATRERPVEGTRGDYSVTMRHAVSTVTRGRRMTLGVIFHDAR